MEKLTNKATVAPFGPRNELFEDFVDPEELSVPGSVERTICIVTAVAEDGLGAFGVEHTSHWCLIGDERSVGHVERESHEPEVRRQVGRRAAVLACRESFCHGGKA